jgi:hypothetical protein
MSFSLNWGEGGGGGRWSEGTITKKSPKHYVVPEIHGAYAQGNRRGVQATLCAAALKERNYLVCVAIPQPGSSCLVIEKEKECSLPAEFPDQHSC